MHKAVHILVFDSGVGGLSVYQAIRRRLPQLQYHYLFDNAAHPYGELAADTLIQRVNHLIKLYVAQHDIHAAVIACNTASTLVLPSLRQALSIPVIGVVPAIKPAAALAKKGIGLIATPATVKNPYTQDLIDRFAAQIPVHRLGSTALVNMAEKKLRGIAVDRTELSRIIAPLKDHIDVAVLGCTHFPLLSDEIAQVLPGVPLIDSGEAIARRVETLIGPSGSPVAENEIPYPICSSAPPWQEDALNQCVQRLGFGAVRCLQ
jgi:glutamate racemase